MQKTNEYGIGDVNLTTMMDTLDKNFIGRHKVTLKEFNTTAAPSISAGSVLEVSGALFYTTEDEGITGSPSDGTVYIKIIPDGLNASAVYTNTAPEWNEEKQGWYSPDPGEETERYLEFYIVKTGASYAKYNLKPELKQREFEAGEITEKLWTITSNGTWTAPISKVYKITMCGRGGDSRNVGAEEVSGGGGGALTGFAKKYIEAGTEFTASFSAASLGTCSFSGGGMSFEVQNGGLGGASGANSDGGSGGTTNSGFDYVVNGSEGGGARRASSAYSNFGGSSFFGGTHKSSSGLSSDGNNGTSFGSGASGAITLSSTRSGANGGLAVIIIEG